MTVPPTDPRRRADGPARHARRRAGVGPGPRSGARRGFGVAALATSVVLGLGAGAGAGAVLGLTPSGTVPEITRASDRAITRSAEPTSAPVPTAAPAEPVGGALEPTAERRAAPTLPPLPAVPASPVPLSPTLTDEQGLTLADHAAGLLSATVPDAGDGTLVVVPGSQPAPAPERPVRTVRVEVEGALDVDGDRFAARVLEILNDPRGWGADGSVSFARTDGEADLRVVLASPATTDTLCAPLETAGIYSCGTRGHAVLNFFRWVEGTPEFDDLTTYRAYLVNHEVGHLLGHPHLECPGAGQVAPLMQQQTVGVAPCVPNGWPFPDAG